MSESGRKTLPNAWEWSKGYPECPGVVGGPSGYPGVAKIPSRTSGSGREAIPDVLEWSGDPL